MSRVIPVFCVLAGFAVLAIAVWFRCWDLGRVPGVNGDEAWYGVQAERLAHGKCFACRTPTGNAVNPFFMAPQFALHLFAEPSFALLRAPALASGLIALVLNFTLCLRAFGVRMAWLTTLIHAVLPINIAYSRFAWDSSQSLLVTLPVIYAGVLASAESVRRLRWTVIGLLSLAAAVIVHPTNVFAAPFFIVLAGHAWRDRLASWWRTPVVRRILLPLLGVIVVAALSPTWPRIAHNAGSPSNYSTFVRHFGGLFSGATVYEYISGSLNASVDHAPAIYNTAVAAGVVPATLPAAASLGIALETLSWIMAGVVAAAFFNSIRRGKSTIDAWLMIGWCASVSSFFLVAGTAAIAPHFERYAICLVAPTVVILARGLNWWMQPTTRMSLATGPLLLVVAGGLLATFKSEYFDEFNLRGGRSHLTFRTGTVEPKLHAMEVINERRDRNVPLLIQTSEWWLYWPLEYLAYAKSDIKVELRGPDDPRPLDQQAFADMETWIVEFAEEEAGWNLRKALADLGRVRTRVGEQTIVRDASGRPLLLLIRLPATRPSTKHD